MKNNDIDIAIRLIRNENEPGNRYYDSQLRKIRNLKKEIIKNFLNNKSKLIYKNLYFIHEKQQYYCKQPRKLRMHGKNKINYFYYKEYFSLRGNELSYI